MNEFFNITGAGQEYNNPTQELISLFVPGDTRKEVTVGVPGGFMMRILFPCVTYKYEPDVYEEVF